MEDLASRSPLAERLLIVGIDGIVGANLAVALSDRLAILGLYQHRALELDGCQTAPWKPLEPAGLVGEMRRHRPHWVVYCGPLACGSWDIPEQVPEGEAEAKVVSRLAGLCLDAGAVLTVVSTDAVFAGPRLFHGENDPAGSSRPFAQAARCLERAAASAQGLIVRTHAYGWGPAETEAGFAQRVWCWLAEGAACELDPHCHASPILATDLAELLWLAYRRGLRGLRHVAGAERTSAYRFARELAAAFGLSNRPMPAGEAPLDVDGVHETSLDSRLVGRELGRPMPRLREGLDRFAEQAAHGFRARFRLAPVPAVRRGDAA